MNWTTDKPTETGWYWINDFDTIEVIKVFKRPGHNYLCVYKNIRHFGSPDYIPINYMDCEWSGPIDEPQ